MKKTKHYWIDEDNNKWTKSCNSKKEAKQKSKSLIDCYNCIDCTYCDGCACCIDCKNCKDCTHCTNCILCTHCIDCNYCTSCILCTHCTDCDFYNNCHLENEKQHEKQKNDAMPYLGDSYYEIEELMQELIEEIHNKNRLGRISFLKGKLKELL